MTTEFGVFWGNSLYDCPPYKKPIIEGIMYEGDSICLSGQAGQGKSILALQLICALTTGKAFLDSFDVRKPCNVLYLQTEGDRIETINRMRRMAKHLTIDNSKWVHINLPGIYLNDSIDFERLKSLMSIPQIKYDVLLMDSIYPTIRGDANKQETASRWGRNLRELKGLHGLTDMGFHHHGKESSYYDGSGVKTIEKSPEDVFGSTIWKGYFTSTLKMSKRKDDTYVLEMGKDRSGKGIDKVFLKLNEPDPLYFEVSDTCYADSEAAVKQFIWCSHKWVSSKDIRTACGVSKATVSRATRSLLAKHVIEKKDALGIYYYRKA